MMISLNNNNNNKESFELLAGSDRDSCSSPEIQQLVIPPRKKRFRRRLRNHPHASAQEDIRFGHLADAHPHCRLWTVSCGFFAIVLVVWLVTLTYLAVVLHADVVRINIDMAQVVAAHRGVPDALQECHSVSRSLQKNQSEIIARLSGFAWLLGNLTVNSSEVQKSLANVREQLKTASTNLASTDPSLSSTVATLGSQVKDFNETVERLRAQVVSAESQLRDLTKNTTQLAERVAILEAAVPNAGAGTTLTVQQFQKERDAIFATLGLISANLTTINDTLTGQIRWTSEDQHKDHKTIENLQEMNQNLTTRLTTLEGVCTPKSISNSVINYSATQEVTPSSPSSSIGSVQSNQSIELGKLGM